MTDKELGASKKMLSSIGSFWGFLKNRITGWKYTPTELPKSKTDNTNNTVSQQQPSVASSYRQSDNPVEDQLMDELINQTK